MQQLRRSLNQSRVIYIAGIPAFATLQYISLLSHLDRVTSPPPQAQGQLGARLQFAVDSAPYIADGRSQRLLGAEMGCAPDGLLFQPVSFAGRKSCGKSGRAQITSKAIGKVDQHYAVGDISSPFVIPGLRTVEAEHTKDSSQFTSKAQVTYKAAGKVGQNPGVRAFQSGFVIPGLRTVEARQEKAYNDGINISFVFLQVNLPTPKELTLRQTCYRMSGKLSLKDLATRVCYEINLDMSCPMQFSVDGLILPEGTLMSTLFNNHFADDGFPHLLCDISEDPLTSVCWILVSKKSQKDERASTSSHGNKIDTAAFTKHNRASQSMNVTPFSYEMTVPYCKFLNWKTKGCRKTSQFIKKRLMELSSHQKMHLVETAEGPAVLSFGSYGPSGVLQFE